MKILPRGELDASAWDALCDGSPDTWLFHRSAWCDLERRQFALSEHSFAIVEGERVVALCPLYLRESGLGTWSERVLDSGCHRHTGVAVHGDAPAGEREMLRRACLREILQRADALDVDRVQLNVHNLSPTRLGPDREEIPYWVIDGGFRLGLNFGPSGMAPAPGVNVCCADQIVHVKADEATLFGRLDESCRRAVRKAQKAGFTLAELDGAASVDAYYRIARISAERTGESLSPLEYYQAVYEAFAPTGRARILFARHGDVLAGAIYLLVDRAGYFFFGGVSLQEYHQYRVNDWLHWTAILWGKDRGLSAYRLGPTYPELPDDWHTARVSRFKGKWGARPTAILQGSYFRRPERYLEDALREVRRACEPRVANPGAE